MSVCSVDFISGCWMLPECKLSCVFQQYRAKEEALPAGDVMWISGIWGKESNSEHYTVHGGEGIWCADMCIFYGGCDVESAGVGRRGNSSYHMNPQTILNH